MDYTNLGYCRTGVSPYSLNPFRIKHGFLLIQSFVHIANIALFSLQHTGQVNLEKGETEITHKVVSLITVIKLKSYHVINQWLIQLNHSVTSQSEVCMAKRKARETHESPKIVEPTSKQSNQSQLNHDQPIKSLGKQHPMSIRMGNSRKTRWNLCSCIATRKVNSRKGQNFALGRITLLFSLR